MASIANTYKRITSEGIRVDFIPNFVEATHVQHLYFNSAIDGGTFKLRVNGYLTAAITMSGTPATDVASIQAALDALSNLETDEFTVSGTVITDITLTASENKWYTIVIESEALTGNTSNDENLTTKVTTQGAVEFTITADTTKFSWKETEELVSLRSISERAETEKSVGSNVTWDMELFKVRGADYLFMITPGQVGLMTIYPEGKLDGNEYWQMNVIIGDGGANYDDHAAVTIPITGNRLGEFVVAPGSIYSAT